MNKINLYNQDGSLCSEAQFLLSSKPDDMSRGEWIKLVRKFKSLLSVEDLKEFERLRKKKRAAKWRAKNPEKSKETSDKWRAENPKKSKQYNAKWKAKNPDYDAKWYAENTERAKENSKRSQRKQQKRPENKLRNAVLTAFKKIGQNKPTDTLTLLGCTWEEAKAHFESLFLEGMTWENHGRGEGKWQIDHIRPVASFKGASEEELKQMNHISNLQPLWAIDNVKKGDKWDGELYSGILNSEV